MWVKENQKFEGMVETFKADIKKLQEKVEDVVETNKKVRVPLNGDAQRKYGNLAKTMAAFVTVDERIQKLEETKELNTKKRARN